MSLSANVKLLHYMAKYVNMLSNLVVPFMGGKIIPLSLSEGINGSLYRSVTEMKEILSLLIIKLKNV